MKRRNFETFILALLVLSQLSFAQQVRYVISLADPARHLVHVSVEVPPGETDRELQLPVWNALYQVRDFSQYMNWIRAEDQHGKALSVSELNKSRWKISGAEDGARVEYELLSNDPGPYGAELNPQHAFFNLAEVLCYIEGERGFPARVEIRGIPPGWKIATSLALEGSAFSAQNYDELVDSPVEVSRYEEQDFTQSGADYRVVVDAADSRGVLARMVPVIQRIVAAETAWMNDCPFHTYTFIYHFSDAPGDGGMEHAYGTAITLPSRYLNESLDRFVSITAHEFFHLWNVKRIRPQSLEPIDYTKENYTPSLWFSEGVDSTVSDFVQLRAGLLDERNYLKHIGEEITELESRPAHLSQSAEQSSIDAWLEKYPYYNLPARSISYYNKGELLGVLLDLKMREATSDRRSIRELFQSLNSKYAKRDKFFADSEGIRDEVESLTQADFRDFFAKYVTGVEEIPWDQFFRRVGLRVNASEMSYADPGFDAAQIFDQPLTVVEVEPGGAADRAGLQTGDRIVEVDGHRGGRELQTMIAKLAPGSELHVVVARGPVQQDLQWALGIRKQKVFRLEDVPDLSREQKVNRQKWLFDRAAEATQPNK